MHLALADVTDRQIDPDRRAWHLAAAATGPDEEIASELEHSAGRAQARGGLAAAAAFLQRSVALTGDPGRRVGRALAAARANLYAGTFDTALRMLLIAEAGSPDELQRARTELLRAQIAFSSNIGSDAPPLLVSAARRLERLDPELARETYLDAWGAAMFAGRLATAGGLIEVSRAVRAAPASAHTPHPSDLLLARSRPVLEPGMVIAGPLLVSGYAARAWGACWLWLRTAKSTGNRRMRPARPRNRGLRMFAIGRRDPCRAIQIADCTDSGADCLPDPVQVVGPVHLGDGHHHALGSHVCHRAPQFLVSVACVAATGLVLASTIALGLSDRTRGTPGSAIAARPGTGLPGGEGESGARDRKPGRGTNRIAPAVPVAMRGAAAVFVDGDAEETRPGGSSGTHGGIGLTDPAGEHQHLRPVHGGDLAAQPVQVDTERRPGVVITAARGGVDQRGQSGQWPAVPPGG